MMLKCLLSFLWLDKHSSLVLFPSTTATNIDSSVLTAGICFFTNNLPNLFALFNNVVGNSLVVVKLIKLQCKSYLFSNTN